MQNKRREKSDQKRLLTIILSDTHGQRVSVYVCLAGHNTASRRMELGRAKKIMSLWAHHMWLLPTLFFFISSPLVALFSHEHLRWFRVSSCHVVRALSQGDRKGQTDKQIERKRKILYWLAHVTNSYHYHHHHTHSDSITQSRQKQPKPQRGGRPVILKPPYRCAIITTQYNNQKWEKKERIWLYTHSSTTSTYKEK
jgi:hypothetical protein